MGKYILNYTREPINDALYGPRLAYSMHLAVAEKKGGAWQALNHNSGVLFVKATENPDGSLNPKSLKNPWLFQLRDGGFGIIAVRIQGDGEDDRESRGCAVLFTSEDLITYEEAGLIPLEEENLDRVRCDRDGDGYLLTWSNASGSFHCAGIKDLSSLKPDTPVREAAPWEPEVIITDIPGAAPHNVLELPDETADRLVRKLTTPVNISVSFPAQVEAETKADLEKYRASAYYSDGTSCEKRVDWDLSGVDFSQKGTYKIRGRVHQDHFPFPLAENRADPCVARWNGRYYFIATNDADGNHTLYIREADSIPELMGAEEKLLLDSDTYPGIGGLLWAPEFHEVNGRLYIFHAATPGEFFWEESHVMALREGGNPACRQDWSAPVRVVKSDGSDLCEAGREITLDMTCFPWEGDYYAVWSQRQFLPKDLGAWLYIARLDPENPARLLTEPVVLSRPEYGWANNHAFVDEGPFALLRGDKLYLTFSSAAIDSSYVVGLMSIEKGKDLLTPGNWKKKNYPILTSRSVEGEFGTGHNAYVTDGDGITWNTYHARPGVDGPRSSGIRRVHFGADGEPVLDMTEEMDLREEFAQVETRLVIR